jgi:hypothetical protein
MLYSYLDFQLCLNLSLVIFKSLENILAWKNLHLWYELSSNCSELAKIKKHSESPWKYFIQVQYMYFAHVTTHYELEQFTLALL